VRIVPNSEQITKNKHKHHEEIIGKFKKIKPPIFNGEIETGEEAEAWILWNEKILSDI
jgi:hypothetical protein